MPAGSDEPGTAAQRSTVSAGTRQACNAQDAPDQGEFLIRCLAFLLRHVAAKYRVKLDPEGWASLDAVARALRRLHPRFRALQVGAVADAVRAQSSERFEVRGGMIRARYGHSIKTVTVAGPQAPPETLFHGTWAGSSGSIKDQGLSPMGRSCVHLTTSLEYAERVASAAGPDWVVFRVRAGEASRAGVIFRQASRLVWLGGAIAPQFIDPSPVLRGARS